MNYDMSDFGDDALSALIKIVITEGYSAAKKWIKKHPEEARGIGKAALIAAMIPILGPAGAAAMWAYIKSKS